MLVKASSQRQSYGAPVSGSGDVSGQPVCLRHRTASSNEWMSGFWEGP